MNNNFELDDFAARRQDALTAPLVACALEKAAPCMAFFFHLLCVMCADNAMKFNAGC